MRQAGDSLLPTLGFFESNGTSRPGNVTLVGSNFGPASSPLTVTFTSDVDGIVRTATNCTRDPVGHAWVYCTAEPGVGTAHRWRVTVASQMSGVSAATTSYRPPSLTGKCALKLLSRHHPFQSK